MRGEGGGDFLLFPRVVLAKERQRRQTAGVIPVTQAAVTSEPLKPEFLFLYYAAATLCVSTWHQLPNVMHDLSLMNSLPTNCWRPRRTTNTIRSCLRAQRTGCRRRPSHSGRHRTFYSAALDSDLLHIYSRSVLLYHVAFKPNPTQAEPEVDPRHPQATSSFLLVQVRECSSSGIY